MENKNNANSWVSLGLYPSKLHKTISGIAGMVLGDGMLLSILLYKGEKQSLKDLKYALLPNSKILAS